MMEHSKFERLKKFISSIIGKYDIKDMVAEVHNLYQEYLISEKQEGELYKLVDPKDEVDNPAELWYEDYCCLPIWDYAQKL